MASENSFGDETLREEFASLWRARTTARWLAVWFWIAIALELCVSELLRGLLDGGRGTRVGYPAENVGDGHRGPRHQTMSQVV